MKEAPKYRPLNMCIISDSTFGMQFNVISLYSTRVRDIPGPCHPLRFERNLISNYRSLPYGDKINLLIDRVVRFESDIEETR